MEFIHTEFQARWMKKLRALSEAFAERAPKHDEQGTFPFENFKELGEAGYLSLTVPKKYGGQEISLYDYILFQEQIARGDGSTALSVGWHLGVVMDLADREPWNPQVFEKLCERIVHSRSLINRASTEPATGSPTRGGKPQTIAEQKDGQWILNGRKSFTSMAPALDYSIVSASVKDSDQVSSFLVSHKVPGVSIEDKWNTLGMRGTRSDDLILKDVAVEPDDLVETADQENNEQLPKAWLLHIPACYLGIARAARDYAVTFAKEYKPNSLKGPISEVPEVQRKIGLMDLELLKSRQLMYGVIQQWERYPEKRQSLGSALAAVKYSATNSANDIVDLAMRIVGAHSLFLDNPLQRYYRDVRAGLHNPPMDDAVIAMFARKALND
ncbi:acyl-CoA dehydrogenase family protein [Fictibacillus terranigra]|uniref:Acyl-CoA dehydrogenase family protein n=1 Tax=Fictibacillus terranigra TaxID=3058424 RepID=A0ABT8E2T5_9BACL|nr:acyl-CoA dehydrogenase family protein [Fictibacillus sp. CENA-BCM004]MDN4072233.1 acyl-CoA dehydrogenase family protein [Fictibacillus sp. CENA-BCM004]